MSLDWVCTRPHYCQLIREVSILYYTMPVCDRQAILSVTQRLNALLMMKPFGLGSSNFCKCGQIAFRPVIWKLTDIFNSGFKNWQFKEWHIQTLFHSMVFKAVVFEVTSLIHAYHWKQIHWLVLVLPCSPPQKLLYKHLFAQPNLCKE